MDTCHALYELDVLLMTLRLPSCYLLVLLSITILSVFLVPHVLFISFSTRWIPQRLAYFCFLRILLTSELIYIVLE